MENVGRCCCHDQGTFCSCLALSEIPREAELRALGFWDWGLLGAGGCLRPVPVRCFMGFLGCLNVGLVSKIAKKKKEALNIASLPLVLKPPWEGIAPGGCHGPGKPHRQEGTGKPQLSPSHLSRETLKASCSVGRAGI